jgi:DNA-binding response OmpR family regulator
VSRAKILLVEDDYNLGFVVKDNLEMEGFAVTLYDDGEKGWQGFTGGTFDLCILDVMLPRKDGFELARAIRQRTKPCHPVPDGQVDEGRPDCGL